MAAAVAHLAGDLEELPTVRELAAGIGVTHRALYRHFPSKDDLAAAVAGEGFARLVETVSSVPQASPRQVLQAYIEFAVCQPGLYRFMFSLGASLLMQNPVPGPQVRTLIAIATSAFGNGRDDALVRDRVVSAWGMAHGLLDLWRNGALRAAAPDQASAYILARLDACGLLRKVH